MDAAALAHALGAVRSGRQWKCRCVAHEDREPSMIIFDGREHVQVRCLAGCGQDDLISALRRRGFWWPDHRLASSLHSTGKQQQATKVSHETQMMLRARRAFDDATLTIGTIAEDYLASREIWSVARELEDVRFHGRCPRGQGVQPAIVVAMRSVHSFARELTAVQRIFLLRDDYGRVVKDGAMMLGPVRDAAMQLQPLRQHVALVGARSLHIAEGLESALSVAAMDHGPVWALGSCGAIERFEVLDGVDRLVIWADNDEPGQKAADACADRWAEAGRSTLIRTPNHEGWDAADVWRARNARQ